MVENPIWYYARFQLFQLLWFENIIKSGWLFHWVVSISGLYFEHMLLVSCCWLRHFTRILVCVLDVGLKEVRWKSLFFPCTYSFSFPAFMCQIIPLFDWYSLFLLILLRFIVDWILGWLWPCFASGGHLMSLFIIKIDQYIAVINVFWWILRLWMELSTEDSYKFSYDQKHLASWPK